LRNWTDGFAMVIASESHLPTIDDRNRFALTASMATLPSGSRRWPTTRSRTGSCTYSRSLSLFTWRGIGITEGTV
jgi:hypothetical protein